MIFADKEKAAKSIAKIFKDMGWNWYECNKPDEQQILQAFAYQEESLQGNDGSVCHGSGRIFAEKIRDTDQIVFGLDRKSMDEWAEWCENLSNPSNQGK